LLLYAYFFPHIARSEGAIIIGDHDITVHVKSGENLIQSCKVNAEQHRSVTIRWGKIIDPTKTVPAYEGDGKEIIRLSNIAFIVFPLMPTSEASNKLTSSAPAVSAPFAVSDPGSPESQLVIQRVTGRDAGMYICSVITESGWDDRKLVRVVVSDAQTEPLPETEENSYSRRLALYIAAPVVIFFVCIFIISYCLINRKSRRCSQMNGNHTRATLPVMRQMGNSNNSMGMYRGGLNGTDLAGKTNAMGLMDHHMTHQSPQGPPSSAVTAPPVKNNNHTMNSNGNHIAYSSSTGSHSLSGTSAGTPGSMLLANTMVQVLPPDGSGYPLLKPNGHHHHGHPVSQPAPPHSAYDPYNTGHMNGGGMVYMPSGYHDFQA
uniref:Ig-like domain-containing protein n=1 Tax=Rodentolepis nana TaxID=102285 RepID=A0A0R3TD61_RODNA